MSRQRTRTWFDLHRSALGVGAILVASVTTAGLGGIVITRIGSLALTIPPFAALLTPALLGVGVAMLASYQVDLRVLGVRARSRARRLHSAWLATCVASGLLCSAMFGLALEPVPGEAAPTVATLLNGALFIGLSLCVSGAGAPGLTWAPAVVLFSYAVLDGSPTPALAPVAEVLTTHVSTARVVVACTALAAGTVSSVVWVGGSNGPLGRFRVTT